MKLIWEGEIIVLVGFYLAPLARIWELAWFKNNVFKWFVYNFDIIAGVKQGSKLAQ